MFIKPRKSIVTPRELINNPDIIRKLINNSVHALRSSTDLSSDIEEYFMNTNTYDNCYTIEEFIRTEEYNSSYTKYIGTEYNKLYKTSDYDSCDLMNLMEDGDYETCELVCADSTYDMILILRGLLSDLFTKDYMRNILEKASYASVVMSEILLIALSEYIYLGDLDRNTFIELTASFIETGHDALLGGVE